MTNGAIRLEITIRPLTDPDLPTLARWLAKPHVAPWYTPAEDWLAEVRAREGEYAFIRHFIIEADGVPIGFCQHYPLLTGRGGLAWEPPAGGHVQHRLSGRRGSFPAQRLRCGGHPAADPRCFCPGGCGAHHRAAGRRKSRFPACAQGGRVPFGCRKRDVHPHQSGIGCINCAGNARRAIISPSLSTAEQRQRSIVHGS